MAERSAKQSLRRAFIIVHECLRSSIGTFQVTKFRRTAFFIVDRAPVTACYCAEVVLHYCQSSIACASADVEYRQTLAQPNVDVIVCNEVCLDCTWCSMCTYLPYVE